MLKNFLPFTRYPYTGKLIDCPVCGSGDHSPIARFDRRIKLLPTSLCNHCGLFFTNPMPTDEELDRYYASSYRAEYQFAFIRPRKTHQNKKKREAARRAQRIEAIVKRSAPFRFLDFGCGSGEVVRHLAALGCDAHGFEQGEDFGAFAREKLAEETKGQGAIHVGSWRMMTFPPGRFDVISCLHVLEHLNEPMPALQKIHSWLAEDGVLYLETPNMQNYPLKGFDCFHFAHVLGFSRANLMHAAALAGFALLHAETPTSLFLVKSGNLKGRPLSYDLAATAHENRADYTAGITPATYAGRHFRRIGRMLRSEIKSGR